MIKLSPVKQSFLGGLTAQAQDSYNPEKAIDHNGQIDVVDIQEQDTDNAWR